jgi:hypothetical protein
MASFALPYEGLMFLIPWCRVNHPESRIDCAVRRHPNSVQGAGPTAAGRPHASRRFSPRFRFAAGGRPSYRSVNPFWLPDVYLSLVEPRIAIVLAGSVEKVRRLMTCECEKMTIDE